MAPDSQWIFALIVLLPGVLVSGEPEIWAVEGDTMTLQCTYSVTDNERTTMCWRRGGCTSLLSNYCDNKYIIKTDGSKVTKKTPNRYQLLGNIERGNVSLTITNVTKEDKGIYCCRVEISGWFNDKTNTYNVKVQERDKSDASTESNDRDKQEGTSDLAVTKADDLSSLGVLVSGEPEIWAVEGDTMTLQCTYSVTDNKRTSMCWRRGGCTSLFSTYCNNYIIKTDGSKVTEKTSNRYQLLGNIKRGNVSLTITNVSKEDKGIYCCRVEISGLFNDKKNTYSVKVQETYKSDASTESNDRDEQEGTSGLPVTKADYPSCSDNHDDDNITYPSVNSSPMTPLKINTPSAEVQSTRTLYILIPTIVLIAIAFTTVLVCRNKAKDKTPLVSAGPMTELAASGITAEENIYTED